MLQLRVEANLKLSPEILLLCAGSGVGGMERVVLNLATAFSQRQCHVRVILPESDNALQTQRWFEQSGISPEISQALKHSFGKRRFSGMPALRLLLQQSSASVVNIHYGMNFPSLNEVLAIRLAGKRCVVSLHAGGGADPPARQQRKIKNRIAASLCSTVVAVSTFQAAKLIQNGVPPHKIRTISHGVIPPRGQYTQTEARGILGIPQDVFLVASACRLTHRKGIADLIEALSLLPRARRWQSEVYLAVAGTGEERESLETLALRLLPNRFRLLGLLSDTNLLYAAADLFCLPSYEESFGLVYAEAALNGVPSVGTNVGGVPETVLAGRTGLLVPPGDIARLAEAIETLWVNDLLRLQMGQEAKRRALCDFALDRMADQYQQVLFPATAPVEHCAWNDLYPATGLDS